MSLYELSNATHTKYKYKKKRLDLIQVTNLLYNILIRKSSLLRCVLLFNSVFCDRFLGL